MPMHVTRLEIRGQYERVLTYKRTRARLIIVYAGNSTRLYYAVYVVVYDWSTNDRM